MSQSIAEAVRDGQDVESLTRPLLELLGDLSGLESTYLTEINGKQNKQEIVFSRNVGTLTIPEGLQVEWSDTLCRRALQDGPRYTKDVPHTFPGSKAAEDLGLMTYVSVPVNDPELGVVGTLCGASGSAIDVSQPMLELMEVFARLISDQRARDQRMLTAESRAAEVEKRLSSRAMFLAQAEHKLKSPLTAILGWSSMLSDDWESFDDPTRMDAVKTIYVSSQQLRRQVDELLDEAQAEVLVGDLELMSVDVHALFERVESEHAEAKSRGYTFRVEGPRISVQADRTALWHVLSHLVDNSVKYSQDGTRIVLRTRYTDGMVSVEVSDEGIGIPDDLDVFAPFTRSKSAIETGATGSGLGLHIVRNLVDAMHGTVGARNNASRGSTFAVVVPVADAPLSAADVFPNN